MIPPSYKAMLAKMSPAELEQEEATYVRSFRETWPYRDRVIARAILPVHIARLRHLHEFKTLTSR